MVRHKDRFCARSACSVCLFLLALLFLVACLPVSGIGTTQPQPTQAVTPDAPTPTQVVTPPSIAGPETTGELPLATTKASNAAPTATTTSATEEATAVPSLTATLPSPTETALLHGDPLLCQDVPQRFDLYAGLGLYDIAAVRFLDDDTLLVDGWIPRQLSTFAQDLNAPRLIFTQVRVDLLTGEILADEPIVSGLSVSPCTTTECKVQSISQSPDTGWQLVTAGGNEEEIGTWLVGSDSVKRLVDFVPYSLKWTWADDGSLLWLTYSLPEFGTGALTVQLEPDVVISEPEGFSEYAAPLNPTSHILAISPVDKQIISSVRGEYSDLDKDDYASFDSAAIPPQIVSTVGPLAGLHTVIWDNTGERFLLVALSENGMEIRLLNGATLLRVPMATFAGYFPSGDQLLDDPEQLEGLVPTDNYTISPNGQTLAIPYGAADGVVVFTCQPYEETGQ